MHQLNVYEDNVMLNRKLTKNIILSTVFAASFGLAGIASASSSDFRATSVSYADLDLNQASDQEALYKRLKMASENVCGRISFSKNRSLRANSNVKQCYRNSLNNAVEVVENSALTELHKSS